MTFVEAAKLLQESGGHILRRTSWADLDVVIRPRTMRPTVCDWWIADVDGSLIHDRCDDSCCGSLNAYKFSADDLTATDWEVGTVGAITWEGGEK